MHDAQPDPKPRRRVRLSNAKYLALAAAVLRAYPLCACGCGRRATSCHHVIGGNSKEDVRENLVGLYGDGVTGCHGAFTHRNTVWDGEVAIEPEQVAKGIRRTMEISRRDVLDYVLGAKGQAWLDLRYPQ